MSLPHYILQMLSQSQNAFLEEKNAFPRRVISATKKIYTNVSSVIEQQVIMSYVKDCRGGHGKPSAVFLPGKSQGQRSPVDYSPWGCKESDVTEAT